MKSLGYHHYLIKLLVGTLFLSFGSALSHDLAKAENTNQLTSTENQEDKSADSKSSQTITSPRSENTRETNITVPEKLDTLVSSPSKEEPKQVDTLVSPISKEEPKQVDTLVSPISKGGLRGVDTLVSPISEGGLRGVNIPLDPNTTNTENTQVTKIVKILTPKPEEVLNSLSTSVIVQFSLGSQIELRVNGQLVEQSLLGRTETNPDTKLVTQTWYGIGLKEGQNDLSATIGEKTDTVQISVTGAATQLKIESLSSRIPADGRSTAIIQGQLLDKDGNRSNQDAVITLTPTAGKFIDADLNPDQPGFQVQAKEGLFTAKLLADNKAQTVRISAITTGLEAFTQLQFETALRPSLLTGFIDLRLGAKGTDYYSRYRDFLPVDRNNDPQFGFNSAIFATGAIGEWLFTGAYNSSRSLNEGCDCDTNLFATGSSNNQTYPVNGDSSKSELVTPSISSVFVRLERSSKVPGANPDYLTWGDYNTEEFARPSQQFTSISRQLNGFKSNYNLGSLAITGFYSQYVKGFQRDTIAPDGTSGYYFLSRRILVGGSENIYLELEELNRPGTVVKRQKLERGTDYDIDYDRGTVLFKSPIFRTAVNEYGQILVRKIIVSYEYDAKNSDGQIYASRLQYNLSGADQKQSWLGTTFLQESQGLREFQIYGADTQISFTNAGKLTAEYAHSQNSSELLGPVSGQAYRLELEGQLFSFLTGRTYYTSVDTGFANNATTSFVPGQTRYGVQAVGKVTNSTNLRWQYDHEDNFGLAPVARNTFEELFTPQSQATTGSAVNNSLTTVTAGVQQRFGQSSVDLDWIYRQRQDRMSSSNSNTNSQQLRSRLNVPLAKSLTFQAQNELSLTSQQDSVYPARTTFGLNWAAMSGVNVSLSHQIFNGGQFSGNSVTSLNLNGEQKLGADTSLTGRYSIVGSSDQMSTQGAIGLKNRLTIAPGLLLNVGYEHVFGSFFNRNASSQQFSQPFAFGQAGSSVSFNSGDSYSAGLEYTDNPNFQASTKYEYRSSAGGTNTVITSGITGKVSPSLTALARYQQASSANQNLGLGDSVNVKMGLAYRDINSDQFNALFRYEYRQNPATIPDSILLGTGTGATDHTFAVETIYAPNWQWEFYGKYAFRNSTSYLSNELVGTSSVNLSQLRATYRLGYSLDLVGESRLITQGNYMETGFVLETGYYLTPNLRLAAGYAFGKVEDRDFSGSRAAGGAYLGLTVKLNELFEGFGLQKVAPKQQQESVTKETPLSPPLLRGER
jgi:hypothetical protein